MHIYRETISDTLWVILNKLMRLEVLDSFRLVGGTSLSLLLGHRVSIDIDMFTDLAYGSIDFMEIYRILEEEFEFIEGYNWQNSSIGNSCFLGENEEDIVKVDFFYTDCFVLPICKLENLRLAQLEEIAAMKLDVVGRGGRKKDFWDIHALLDHFSIDEMMEVYLERYPYSFSVGEIMSQLVNFEKAEDEPNPNCLRGKHWELIKLDLEDLVGE